MAREETLKIPAQMSGETTINFSSATINLSAGPDANIEFTTKLKKETVNIQFELTPGQVSFLESFFENILKSKGDII